MNKKLLAEMNRISAEVSRVVYPRKPKVECNIMGCRNKPKHKFKVLNMKDRFIWTCKKHRQDYVEGTFNERFQEVLE